MSFLTEADDCVPEPFVGDTVETPLKGGSVFESVCAMTQEMRGFTSVQVIRVFTTIL